MTDASERTEAATANLVDADLREESTGAAAIMSSAELADTFGISQPVLDAMDELMYEFGFEESDSEAAGLRAADESDLAHALSEPVGLENIVCFGTGYKNSHGFDTPQECVKVYVRRKATEREIADGLIPAEINGIPTDVEVLPPTELRYASNPCGNGMLSPDRRHVGTIGCLCVRENKPMILTNNHVAADFDRAASDMNSGGNGVKIYRQIDGAWFGNLYDFAPLARTYVDADAAIVHTARGYVESKHRAYSMAVPEDTVRVGDLVVKDGYRTNYTQARFAGIIRNLPVTIPQGTIRHRVVQVYHGNFSTNGDSGSIIARKDNLRPVGLLWGGPEGNSNVTYATPISTVKSVLRIERFLAGGEF